MPDTCDSASRLRSAGSVLAKARQAKNGIDSARLIKQGRVTSAQLAMFHAEESAHDIEARPQSIWGMCTEGCSHHDAPTSATLAPCAHLAGRR